MKNINELTYKIPTRNTRINNREQDLADRISTEFGEKKRFGLYMRLIKKHGYDRVEYAYKTAKDEYFNGEVRSMPKYFMWLLTK